MDINWSNRLHIRPQATVDFVLNISLDMRSLLSFVLLSFAATTFGAIGPNANVAIGNKNIAPDGFTRS